MSADMSPESSDTEKKPLKKKSSSKRKRDSDAPVEEEELEIDVDAPEPPSKKAKRKEKQKAGQDKKNKQHVEERFSKTSSITTRAQDPATQQKKKDERSDYGVWIGNLPFAVTKDDVRRFLSEQGGVAETLVTRVHMPAPADGKSKNKGFAYVDLSTAEALEKAIGLSEKLLGGRRTLIKNSKSFEGRPEKAAKGRDGESTGEAKAKEATKRVFVGNLSFDVTREDIAEHFGQAGEVEDVFLATFEDSGKCKGFGWVRFKEVSAAEAAVKGFVRVKGEGKAVESDEDSEAEVITDKDEKKKQKKSNSRKLFINRLNGRPLRCEFAEDAQTRYKKRYGKDSKYGAELHAKHAAADVNEDAAPVDGFKPRPQRKENADERREHRRKRHDARTIAPGQSLANAPRASAAIVAGSGKKISFE